MASESNKNMKAAQEARRKLIAEGKIVTPAIREEAITLLESGATAPEITDLLNLSESQVDRIIKRHKTEQNAAKVSQSVQYRSNRVSDASAELARAAHPVVMRLIGKLNSQIDDETDIAKLATAIKTLHALTQGAEERTEITATVTRLRGR